MKLDDFIKKYNNTGVDFDFSFGFQCVDLYRTYVKEVLQLPQSPGVVGAKDIWNTYLKDKYDRIENTPTAVPQKGDIIIWGASYGPFGHVAICVEANINTFKAFSQNDPVNTPSKVRDYKSYKGVLGWLHPKGDIIPPDSLVPVNGETMPKILDNTKIPQIENMEVQAIRSIFYDRATRIEQQDREIRSLKGQLVEAQKPHVIVEEITHTPFPNFIDITKAGFWTKIGYRLDGGNLGSDEEKRI